ncbi:MAG: winged helix-turn-helix transcriptional regulator [Candidatus Bathyarchaeota archaeon]|nr:winged helix-turn-helix transcriptional regulator [Candidatus Bathyarchaeota archaeon]
MRKPPQDVLLRDKSEFTKFQILLEVMRNQPHVKQKDISDRIGITIQAISKYFKRLSKEGLLEAGSERADYRLTPKAVDKLQEDLHHLNAYVSGIKRDLNVEHALPALATTAVKEGDKVGIIIKDGILYTVSPDDSSVSAKGTVLNDAKAGEDLGLIDLEGKVPIKQGRILLVKMPSISDGGSRAVDLDKVKAFYDEFKPDRIGVMGAVGRAVLSKLDIEPTIEFGLSRAAAVAASRGLNVFVLVVGRMVNRMIEEIDNINLKNTSDIVYEVKDARLLPK